MPVRRRGAVSAPPRTRRKGKVGKSLGQTQQPLQTAGTQQPLTLIREALNQTKCTSSGDGGSSGLEKYTVNRVSVIDASIKWERNSKDTLNLV
ncbi:unnamed protein product [Protopolystoma xenopodis]|uniref:Uncharacterized protein n=1 Tax=Protopolystoma xenopodis TaxID=117903 RepID=A0A448XN74_9PLAT|nr:unnamed protein product [Protopolystoma xenopodis]